MTYKPCWTRRRWSPDMNELLLFPGVTIALCIFLAGAVLLFLLREWQPKPDGRRAPRSPPSTLPAMLRSEMDEVLEQAEEAALRRVVTGRAVGNPHPRGSRAFVLWETQYHRSLLDSVPWPQEADKPGAGQ